MVEFQRRYPSLQVDGVGVIGPKAKEALYCFVDIRHAIVMMPSSRLNPPSLERSGSRRLGLRPNDPWLFPSPPRNSPYPDPLFPNALIPYPQLQLATWTLEQLEFEVEGGGKLTHKGGIKSLGPLNILEITADAQLGMGHPGGPPDFSSMPKAGPTIWVFDSRLVFGVAPYLTLDITRDGPTLTPGVAITGTLLPGDPKK